MPFMITQENKIKIQKIVNVFETGNPDGKYHTLVRLPDGPGGIRQITYGRSQTTEFGNLKRLIELYISRNGSETDTLKPFVSKIGKTPSLGTNQVFVDSLKLAGLTDPIMQKTQDDFFDLYYYQPALIWFEGFGFTLPLSLLVIYDSFIHSGGIRNNLRQKFATRPPKFGGDEKKWITEYADARHNWLKYHKRKILNGTVYRTNCFKEQFKNDNWDLSQPVKANGVLID